MASEKPVDAGENCDTTLDRRTVYCCGITMPSRLIDTLKRWKYPPRRTDIALPAEGVRDPRLPAAPDPIDEQLKEALMRRRVLSRLQKETR